MKAGRSDLNASFAPFASKKGNYLRHSEPLKNA